MRLRQTQVPAVLLGELLQEVCLRPEADGVNLCAAQPVDGADLADDVGGLGVLPAGGPPLESGRSPPERLNSPTVSGCRAP